MNQGHYRYNGNDFSVNPDGEHNRIGLSICWTIVSQLIFDNNIINENAFSQRASHQFPRNSITFASAGSITLSPSNASNSPRSEYS
jgi:hypothetical protein